MYCKNCGNQIDDNSVVCVHCGANTGKTVVTSNTASSGDINNTMAIVGFVLSFFIPIAGLICSIIGYKKAIKEGYDKKGLALAGIIISALSMVFNLIISIIYGAAIFAYIMGGTPYALMI